MSKTAYPVGGGLPPGPCREAQGEATGDGRLLALLQVNRQEMLGVGLDFSKLVLEAARKRFAGDERIELVEHDLAEPLPALGRFDDVDCYWKWLEMALLIGVKPAALR